MGEGGASCNELVGIPLNTQMFLYKVFLPAGSGAVS